MARHRPVLHREIADTFRGRRSPVTSYAAPVLRIAGWASAVLLSAALLLWLTRPGAARLWVQSPTPSAATARCPKGTLEDHNVCVPVPAPERAEVPDSVSKLPGLPDALTAYDLPIAGTAELVDVSLAPLPGSMQLPGRALVVRSPQASELPSARLLQLGKLQVLAHDAAQGWLLLAVRGPEERAAPAHLVLLAGLRQLSPPHADWAEAPETLASVDALWVVARQLRPGAKLDSAAWSVDASIPVDPRNVLPVKATASD